MDILKQELAKKRQTLAEQTGGRKFFKRSEIEQKRVQNLKEQQKQEQETKLKNQTPSQPNTDTKHKKPEPTSNINTSNNIIVSNEQKIDSLNLKMMPNKHKLDQVCTCEVGYVEEMQADGDQKKMLRFRQQWIWGK
ncbi:splicing factor Prp18 family protein [Artemisia annua]|uniref:Splicing factor Prp18 family protein n=1 Tax=Artemisia annua TaxID=35608 RepID=A0A2U1QFH9_ARTAN|nr:splicing factor Prp18 family protein [Artemisia annua]